MSDNVEMVDEQIEVIIEGEEETSEEEVDEVAASEDVPETPSVTQEDLAAVRAETENFGKNISESIKDSVNDLAEKLTTPPKATPPSEEDLIAKDKGFYKAPTKNVEKVADELFQKKIAPLQNHYIQTNEVIAKRLAYVDKETSPIMEKYGKEVEEAVKQMSPEQRLSPDAYNVACKAVQAVHMEDIIQERIDEALKKKEDEMTKAGYVGKVDNQPPAPKKTVKKFTREEIDNYTMGLDLEDVKNFVTPKKDRGRE